LSSSWKIGAVSGLVSGFIAGITTVMSLIIVSFFGLPHYISGITDSPILNLAINEIILAVVWGVLLGLIYSCTYEYIPGEKVSKGIFFGMICYFIYNIRTGMLLFFYGDLASLISAIIVGFFTWITFGLVLAILDNKLHKRNMSDKEKQKIRQHDLKNGIYPGAFAGIAMAISVFIVMATIFDPQLYQKYATDIGFLTSQLGSHMLFNIIFGIVFGVLFVMFYEKVPGNGVLKGIIFSLIIFLNTSLRVGITYFAYGLITLFYLWAIWGFLYFPIYGLVLGYLYRKPSE
jgi:hypothetical protein